MVDQGLVGLAFAAGLVAALNPCGFAMLPGYLLLAVRGQQPGDSGSVSAAGRALAATAGMALGFLTVFGVYGALTISVASTVRMLKYDERCTTAQPAAPSPMSPPMTARPVSE